MIHQFDTFTFLIRLLLRDELTISGFALTKSTEIDGDTHNSLIAYKTQTIDGNVPERSNTNKIRLGYKLESAIFVEVQSAF